MKEKSSKPVGIKALAKLANVSIGTIDRVLHDRPGVSPKTKERVKKIIEEVGYNPNPLARRLANFNTTYTIAVILPEKSEFNPYWGQHLLGIEKALAQVNLYGVEVEPIFFDFNKEASFAAATEKAMENRYDAIILAPLFRKRSLAFADECTEKNIPLVCIDTDLDHPQKLSFIGQDSYQSGFLAGKIISWKLLEGQKVLVCHLEYADELPENLKKREEGLRNYLIEEAKISADQLIRLEVDTKANTSITSQIQDVITKNKTIKCLFIPNAQCFLAVASLTEKQKKDIFIVAYDLIDENIFLLKDGIVDVLISQKPAEQCHKAITILYEKLIAKKAVSSRLNMPVDIIVKENIEYYLQENQQL